MPSVSLTSLRDIARRIPKLRNRLPWGPDQYLFGLEGILADKDAIVAHGASAWYSDQAARLCSKMGKPLIVQEVVLVPFRDLGSRTHLRRMRALSSAQVVTTVTERGRATLLIEGVPKEKIRIIPYGIDTGLFNPDARQADTRSRLGLSDDQLVILSVGHIRWDKGVFDLVHAAKLLADDPALGRHSLQFAFVGTGPESDFLQKRINYLGLGNTCRLVGSIAYDEMPAVYAGSDIVTAASIPGRRTLEQWCLVLSEAMATATPVIATHCGGMPEVVGDAGILVQPGDPYSLADGIKRLVLNPELRRELGAAGLRKVREVYDSRIVGAQYADLLDEVLSA